MSMYTIYIIIENIVCYTKKGRRDSVLSYINHVP